MNLVIPDLIRNPAEASIGAPCAPLYTGLRRYDGVTIYWPDQYILGVGARFIGRWLAIAQQASCNVTSILKDDPG